MGDCHDGHCRGYGSQRRRGSGLSGQPLGPPLRGFRALLPRAASLGKGRRGRRRTMERLDLVPTRPEGTRYPHADALPAGHGVRRRHLYGSRLRRARYDSGMYHRFPGTNQDDLGTNLYLYFTIIT